MDESSYRKVVCCEILKQKETMGDNMSTTSDEFDQQETWHSFAKYIDRTNRLNTFHNWPKKSKVISEKLSYAGFFYRGVGKQVACFSCGKLWDANKVTSLQKLSDIWKSHVRLDKKSKCDYVLMVKGSEFIESVWQEDYDKWWKKIEKRIAEQNEGKLENEPHKKKKKKKNKGTSASDN